MKRLNSHQAHWVLFLSCFHFTLTYLLGSRNTKPDTHSRQFSTDQSVHEPKPITTLSCVMDAVTWQVEERVREALRAASVPDSAPPSTLFVPDTACSEVLQWGHVSKLACHMGLRRTLHLLWQRIWWPAMTCYCPIVLTLKLFFWRTRRTLLSC